MDSASKLFNEFKCSSAQEASELRNYLVDAGVEIESLVSLSDLLPYLPKATGFAFALYLLYRMREEGVVLQKDLVKAFSLCESAAKLGFSKAQFDLAMMYAHGLGVSVNNSEALNWYVKASENNNPDALYHLAMMYETGLYGCVIDCKKAACYYEKAVELNSVDAMVSLASLYKKGECVKKDIKKAVELYEKATENGSINAHMQLAFIYNMGDKDFPKDLDKANAHLSAAEKLQLTIERSMGIDD